jgi:predicted lipoprotein
VDQIALEFIKLWGPPGIIALVMFYFLKQSEKREEAKDKRIQLLENLIMESYSERIEAADRIAEAMHSNANAYNALVNEIRGRRK